jgi:LysM repeat protein
MITPLRILTPVVLAAAAISCSPQKPDSYDTPPGDPYATAPAQPAQATNPIYDSTAAYDDSSAVTPAAPYANAPTEPTLAPPPPANAPAIIHTVVPGDTLGGISAKYKVPIASIMQANQMTKDTVVLGRKMVIPPR